MKKHYKIKQVNKTKLKTYLTSKNNKKNERNTRQRTSNAS